MEIQVIKDKTGDLNLENPEIQVDLTDSKGNAQLLNHHSERLIVEVTALDESQIQ